MTILERSMPVYSSERPNLTFGRFGYYLARRMTGVSLTTVSMYKSEKVAVGTGSPSRIWGYVSSHQLVRGGTKLEFPTYHRASTRGSLYGSGANHI